MYHEEILQNAFYRPINPNFDFSRRLSGFVRRKIKHTRARNSFADGQGNQSKKRKFYSSARYWERREILGWAIKGQITAMHRGKLAAGQFWPCWSYTASYSFQTQNVWIPSKWDSLNTLFFSLVLKKWWIFTSCKTKIWQPRPIIQKHDGRQDPQ